MIDLQECRNEIDKIDSDIIRLFEQRMKVCEDVAEYKIAVRDSISFSQSMESRMMRNWKW